jgi:energy-converting hydrogenase Eha subunit E
MEELAETTGMEMLVLAQNGIPVKATQGELTPLQREVLLRAFIRQKEMERDAIQRFR